MNEGADESCQLESHDAEANLSCTDSRDLLAIMVQLVELVLDMRWEERGHVKVQKTTGGRIDYVSYEENRLLLILSLLIVFSVSGSIQSDERVVLLAHFK